MKRKILIIISFSIVIFLFSGFSFTVKAEDNLEEELKKEIEDYTSSLDVSALQEFCDSLTAEGDRIDLKQLIKDITSGNFVYTPQKLFESIGNTFLRGITNAKFVFCQTFLHRTKQCFWLMNLTKWQTQLIVLTSNLNIQTKNFAEWMSFAQI